MLTTCPTLTVEEIIDAIDNLLVADQKRLLEVLGNERWSDRPRNAHRIAHLRVKCDGECEGVAALRSRERELEAEVEELEDTADHLTDAVVTIHKLRALLDEHDIDHDHID